MTEPTEEQLAIGHAQAESLHAEARAIAAQMGLPNDNALVITLLQQALLLALAENDDLDVCVDLFKRVIAGMGEHLVTMWHLAKARKGLKRGDAG